MLARQVLSLKRAQLQLARDTSLRVDDATLERAIARIAVNNNIGIDQFRATLEKDGVSWTQFRDQIRTEILLTRLREREVDNKVVVTDAEVDNFLASNPDAFSNQEYLLSHILIGAPERPTPEQIERLRARAEAVMARLRAGEDFSRVAAATSDAPDGINGGSLGWRRLDRVPALFARCARSRRAGLPADAQPLASTSSS